MTTINTAKTKQACFEKYGLDVTRVPDTVESDSTKVEVRCLMHDGYYEVSYGELKKRRKIYSPGCPECQRYLRDGDLASYSTVYGEDEHKNITKTKVFNDKLATFPTYVQLHHDRPGYFDRPRSPSDG